ncbi:hypothetical protein NPX13_g6042 [Xylaria arbuscula]|uniref:Cytochrome c oxidase subunit 8, mitochondrial n=1 Tax=Xylaria arbuscula TaxID=114810 RepID=A0A9W8NCW9_9PEZI|nr:hypothetical protein NPX13_g6042 [Xylaria arbuscula]
MSPTTTAFARASPRIRSMISRRAFHATRARLSSPYHYPEGPYSNLPFNTKTRFFAVRYWLYCITGFFAPFGIAGALANQQAQGLSVSRSDNGYGNNLSCGDDFVRNEQG